MAYTNKVPPLSPSSIIRHDVRGNVLLPNGLRVLGLQTAGFVKTTSDGTFYIDTSTPGGGGGSGGHIIYNSTGTALTQRAGLKFIRLTVSDDSVNNLTLVTRPPDTFISTIAPADPVSGDVWTNSETWKTYVYYDSYWVEIGTGSVVSIGGGGGGSGTVTSVSVVTANGFAGTVNSPNTTPAITIRTTVTGVLKGDGTSISAATAGTDYLSPSAFYTDYDNTVLGTRNSVNKIFTTSFNYVSGSTKVYVNGLRYTPGASHDYQETATNQITFANAPDFGDLIIIEYIKS